MTINAEGQSKKAATVPALIMAPMTSPKAPRIPMSMAISMRVQ